MKWTCIVPIIRMTRPLNAQMWITQSYLQIHHICLSFVYAFARGRTAANSFTHLLTDILLIPHHTEGRRLSWPGWLTLNSCGCLYGRAFMLPNHDPLSFIRLIISQNQAV